MVSGSLEDGGTVVVDAEDGELRVTAVRAEGPVAA
jgi:hypothetical protein